MSKLILDEIASAIRNLLPYVEKPVIIAPKGYFENKVIDAKPGDIIEYGDSLTPASAFTILTSTEDLKALTELYKIVGELNNV